MFLVQSVLNFFPIPDEEKPAGARRPQAAPRDGPRRVVANRNARRAAGD